MVQSDLGQIDLLVIGGGVNGSGIARDAAGRGLSVLLCEKDDLAAHTSSNSSKLIHGGLRYLETYQFHLVRKALLEREILLRSAPHLIEPLSFVLPHHPALRPAWMLSAALFLYDHLAPRALLAGSERITLTQHATGAPLQAQYSTGFLYSDARVDDARLVILNAMDAAQRSAKILSRTECLALTQQDGLWHVQLKNAQQEIITLRAKCLVNASGAWAADFHQKFLSDPITQTSSPDLKQNSQLKLKLNLKLIKGSHIVVRKLFSHPYAYIFQNADGRIVFAIPYQDDYTLIGTTDCPFNGDMNCISISADEVAYLCQVSNLYFKQTITADDVVWSYAGVRPLIDDGRQDAKSISRDYRLELNTAGAPSLTVFGGKITTYRKLSEQAVDMLAPLLNNHSPCWTENARLPGGDIAPDTQLSASSMEHFVVTMQQKYAFLPAQLVKRYAHAYGSNIHSLLAGCTILEHMGESILEGLYEIEVRYLVQHEWARCAADILWRRTKLGLHLAPSAENTLDRWLQQTV